MPRGNARTEDQVAEAIADSGGLVKVIAERLAVSWTTAKSYVDGSDRLQLLMRQEAAKIVEIAESHIVTKIKEGDIALCKWYLRMKGQSRGYSMSTTIDVTKRHEIIVRNVSGLAIPAAVNSDNGDVIDGEVTRVIEGGLQEELQDETLQDVEAGEP